MVTPTPFLPANSKSFPIPLERFLPPLSPGVAEQCLDNLEKGSWVLDPFGTAPQLVIEAARAGYRVLVAANNPITRFLIEIMAQPPTEAEFQAALAELAATRRGQERLEPHILDLYASQCPECKQMSSARAFIWAQGQALPQAKIIHCENCGHRGEHPVDSQDQEKASQFRREGPHRARALERIAGRRDPNRVHAEEALESYLPRAVYAFITILNRLDSLRISEENRKRISALVLLSLDRCNSLWEHPSGRPRPKRLTNPNLFREHNVWREMEAAIKLLATRSHHLPVLSWPASPPASGGISIFEGSFRKLAGTLDQFEISTVLTAFPRPNQAFWTLSALWAGWLWGRQAIGPFATVLSRRRYDWTWHCEALLSNLRHLSPLLQDGSKIFAIVGESEPGFNAAVIIAANLAGLHLEGLALRREKGELQLHWEKRDLTAASEKAKDAVDIVEDSAKALLRARGEPSHFLHMHAAALTELSQLKNLAFGSDDAAELFSEVKSAIELGLSYRSGLLRYGGSSRSLEVGHWWLDKEKSARTPLADRLEIAIVRMLLRKPGRSLFEIDREMCAVFPALLTPPIDLLESILHSYGQENQGVWHIKNEDTPKARRSDMQEIKQILLSIGRKLGFSVAQEDAILWSAPSRAVVYRFYPIVSGIVHEILISAGKRTETHNIIVLPGGRSELVLKKIKRDPRLTQALDKHWQFLKFRHLRRLAENEALSQETFRELLNLDPLTDDQVQAPLL